MLVTSAKLKAKKGLGSASRSRSMRIGRRISSKDGSGTMGHGEAFATSISAIRLNGTTAKIVG